jgi:diguanylate cyclase
MTKFIPDLNDEVLCHLVETLTESSQAVSLYDAEDRLRYANKTYQQMFMGEYEGPFTFTDILRHAAKHGLGVRIDDNIDAFIARTLPRRRGVARKSFETDLVNGQWFWMDHTILPNGWVLSVGAEHHGPEA